ncbi:pyridoxine kinase family protein [Streptococcus equinus]|uniref:pyridoxamine kinase n=1 Tax=Streptococcus equinus TaxID=1335 RepID=UPI000F6EA7CB|nr:pyridoxamine kinase [Streptococcus equinus]VEE22403.1 pyridoxine kinase family protein [Streptococcus equinus]
MEELTKSVIVANDIVGLGKVALSSALPVLSSCQIEVIPMPTVLLSSHTGGFSDIHISDLTQAIEDFVKQWNNLDFPCQGIITGYFKTQKQLEVLAEYALTHQLPRFVDPIMADNGRLYAGYQEIFVEKMKQFCKDADVITPNLTEACLLTDLPYLSENYSKTDIEQLCQALVKYNNKHIILTGISFEDDKIGLAHFNCESGNITYHFSKAYPYHFFGTGDLITAILGAGYFHDLSLDDVAEVALDFIDKALERTLALNRDLRFGLSYEPFLPELALNIKRLMEEKV